MGALYDELLSLELDDRLAQLLLATLYSSNHIEVTHRLGEEAPTKAGQITRAQTVLKAEHRRVADAYDPAKVAVLQEAGKLGPHALTTSGDRNLILKGDFSKSSQTIGDKTVPLNPAQEISDVGFDTVAVAFSGDQVFIAMNYKVRRMMKDPLYSTNQKLGYSTFGTISSASLALIRTSVLDEIQDVRRHGEEADRKVCSALRYCKLISPETAPTTDKENALPHAEMQLLSYFQGKGVNLKDMRIGVSKGCCPRCSAELKGAGIGFTRAHGTDPKTSWQPPKEIKTRCTDLFEIPGS